GWVLDARTGLDDRAGAEVSDDVRARWRRRARAGEEIAALDADGLDVQQHAAFGALRVGDVLVAQHVRAAVLEYHRRFHGAIVLAGSYVWTVTPEPNVWVSVSLNGFFC